jgi:hypothetical protein
VSTISFPQGAWALYVDVSGFVCGKWCSNYPFGPYPVSTKQVVVVPCSEETFNAVGLFQDPLVEGKCISP